MPQLNKPRLIGLVLLLIGVASFIRSWLLGGTTDAAGELILGFVSVMLFISIALMAVLLFRAALEWHWYRTEDGKRYQYHVLNPTPELPKKFALWRDELFDLAFEPLGAYTAFHRTKKTGEFRVWVYIDPTKTICAQIVSIPPTYEFVSFETQFVDGFSLEITYQYSANINVNQPAIFIANFISSIPEAYQYHLHQYDLLQINHGIPKTWEMIEDFLPKPETHKEHMRGLFVNRMQDRLKFAGMLLTFVLSCLIGLFVSPVLGAWVGAGLAAIGSGSSLLILDYEAIAGKFRPVDERKTRKEKPATSS